MTNRAMLPFAPLVLALAACAAPPPAPSEPPAETLKRLHATVLEAHREGRLAPWLAVEADDYVQANRGEIAFPTKAERRAAREPYLASTRFSTYRDLREPIVAVSRDGTLGWVVAQVEAEGERTAEDGSTSPVRFVAAWVELYRRDGGRWRMVGNVSNFRPAAE